MAARGVGGCLVALFERLSDIQTRREPLSVTDPEPPSNPCQGAGGFIDHAGRVMVVADPAEVGEY